MAYAFNKIDELLDKNKRFSNTNLFAPAEEAGRVPQDQPRSEGSIPETKPLFKNVAESGYQPEASTKTLSAKQPGRYSQTASDRAAIEANIGKTQVPGTIGNIKGTLEERRKQLQEEANKYLEAQKERARRSQTVSDRDIENVSTQPSGTESSEEAVRRVLNRDIPESPEEFNRPNIEVPEAKDISTDAGIRYLLSKGKGTQYTPGMSEFDLKTLQRTGDFYKNIRDLINQQNQLRRESDEIYGKKKEEATEYSKKQLEEEKKRVLDELTRRAGGINTRNEEDYKKLQDYLDLAEEAYYGEAELPPGTENIFKKYIEEKTRLLYEDLMRMGFTREAEQLKKLPANYIQHGISYNPEDFRSQAEVDSFNRIMKLLGRPETISRGKYDFSKYEGDLSKILNDKDFIDKLYGYDQEKSIKNVKKRIYEGDVGKYTELSNKLDELRKTGKTDKNTQDEVTRSLFDSVKSKYEGLSDLWKNNLIPSAMNKPESAEIKSKLQSMGLPITPENFYSAAILNDAFTKPAIFGGNPFESSINENINSIKTVPSDSDKSRMESYNRDLGLNTKFESIPRLIDIDNLISSVNKKRFGF